jgi:hypothetical protein
VGSLDTLIALNRKESNSLLFSHISFKESALFCGNPLFVITKNSSTIINLFVLIALNIVCF